MGSRHAGSVSRDARGSDAVEELYQLECYCAGLLMSARPWSRQQAELRSILRRCYLSRNTRAHEGTPLASRTNSMYWPGGARFAFVGGETLRPPVTRVKVSSLNRWFMSKAWVTEPGRISVTLAIALGSEVATKKSWP